MLIIISSVLLESGIVQKQINNQKSNNILSFRDKVWNVSIEASRFSPLLGLGLSNWHFIKLSQIHKLQMFKLKNLFLFCLMSLFYFIIS